MGRGDGSAFPEPPTETTSFDAAELKCFPDGGKRPSGPGMAGFAQRLAASSRPAGRSPREMFGEIGPAPAPVRLESRPVQRITIPVDGGFAAPAFLLRPAREEGLLIAAGDRGKESLASDPIVRRALERGWAVCGVDPRGIGELATGKTGWLSAVTLLLGDYFVWRQAGDLLAAADSLGRTDAFAGKPVGLYGRGDNSALASTFAAAEAARRGSPALRWYVLRDGFLSYRQFLDRPESLAASYKLLDTDRRDDRLTAFDREIPYFYFAFDVLRSFDLPGVLGGVKARGLVVDPIDGDWKPMQPAAARRLLPLSVRLATAEEVTRGPEVLDSLLK
jgi:hypothetical protein